MLSAQVMWMLVCGIFLPVSLSPVSTKCVNSDDPEDKNVFAFAKEQGFRVYRHCALTDDGYLLTMHHLRDTVKRHRASKVPVLIVHGLVADSVDWVWNSRNESLAYVVSNHGFDVWLGNTRGSTFSQMHITLTKQDPQFWNCSYDESGRLDFPAMVDHILRETKKSKLFLIVHSMGGAEAMIFLSLRPEYQRKVVGVILMSPACNMTHSQHPIISLDADVDLFENFVGPYPLQAREKRMLDRIPGLPKQLVQFLINPPPSSFSEEIDLYFNKSKAPIYAENQKNQSSPIKCLLHFAQVRRAGQFQRYDYGTEGNLQMYNQPTPPLYPLERISVPIDLYTSGNDKTSSPIDQQDLAKNLNSLVSHQILPNATHLDFAYCINPRACGFFDMICFMGGISPTCPRPRTRPYGQQRPEDSDQKLKSLFLKVSSTVNEGRLAPQATAGILL